MSRSEFTLRDYEVIAREYADLKEVARKRCANQKELDTIQKAFEFANEAHKGIRRRSGEPYILHPIAVAKIVVSNIGLGYKSICAALLHDVVEDTNYTFDDLANLFGAKIASLVEGLTKIKTVLDNEDKARIKSIQAENFKRILLTLNDDVRVVLIKLADRLHNCRTIEYMPEHKRDKILGETMFIFIPLAHRLGLYEVKSEMEDIWLRFKEPEAFNEITAKINRNINDKDKEIEEFIAPIREKLTETGFDFRIKKRVKTPYSIWKKMTSRGISFEQVYDLYAVRIIFNPLPIENIDERAQCYHIFSLITGIYKFKEDRVRDWIRQPKNNGYEALHCTLMSRTGIWIEVQIRTQRMNDIAEKGIAAHWNYKRGIEGYTQESEMDKWISKVQEILINPDVNALELLDLIHEDLMTSDILVFTPKGEQKSIEKGATALDFAYLIHSEIGHKAIAAKVNLKLVPLTYRLRTGDQIEILTAEAEHPKPEWLDFLKTRRARNLVNDYLKSQAKKEALEEAEGDIQETEETSNQKSKGSIFSWFMPKGKKDEENIINDTDDTKFHISTCCNPIPGDSIIGFVEQDGSITIHKKTCAEANRLSAQYGDKIVMPEWGNTTNQSFLVRLSLKGVDRIGIINEISRYISFVMNVNMRTISLTTEDGVFQGYIDLYVQDKNDLEKLIRRLKRVEGIRSVIRTDL